MRAGRLRHRLVLQSKTEARDSYGSTLITWTTEATVWGGIEPLTGKELFAQQQVQSESSVRIVLRSYTGLDETWRVVNGGEVYAINSVLDDDESAHFTTLMCLAGIKEAGDLPTE